MRVDEFAFFVYWKSEGRVRKICLKIMFQINHSTNLTHRKDRCSNCVRWMTSELVALLKMSVYWQSCKTASTEMAILKNSPSLSAVAQIWLILITCTLSHEVQKLRRWVVSCLQYETTNPCLIYRHGNKVFGQSLIITRLTTSARWRAWKNSMFCYNKIEIKFKTNLCLR